MWIKKNSKEKNGLACARFLNSNLVSEPGEQFCFCYKLDPKHDQNFIKQNLRLCIVYIRVQTRNAHIYTRIGLFCPGDYKKGMNGFTWGFQGLWSIHWSSYLYISFEIFTSDRKILPIFGLFRDLLSANAWKWYINIFSEMIDFEYRKSFRG